MSLLRRGKILLSLDLKAILVFFEAWIFLGWARFILIFLPFQNVALRLGDYMMESTGETDSSIIKSQRIIHQSIRIMSKYTFWESKCFVQAIAGMKMLERRNIDATLYLGTANDVESKKMIAHAWLRSGPYYITGWEGAQRFTVVAKFASISRKNKRRRK
ncbi:lasso peptide biosynthesis B2 protein [Neobacillus rhizosphaerae]|uniref:lasso peptide biosynthesis B2 protein n=1 Tax=Neobacillus rhizosphaerae TaxID=2880965 RepID=UPI003D29A6A8